ncbi:putative Heavy metal transport/detoxification superfamily protein [Quillaja saponaria]|uniref:Heavy metal transport/detoxification superfamily protein n=1 Tax=Quillaja saponaria TaxID=32244 RepID=A0AAD7LT83_QUISA|nr:putative Heavy metal transport/detoxification superfamily protein [Quillaja saponaria]
MKQKIVIEIEAHCEKCRTKAMTLAAVADGVISVAFEGEDKNQLVIIGEGVDAAKLTSSLRKKLKYASIVSVDRVEEQVEKKTEDEKAKKKKGSANETKSTAIYSWTAVDHRQPPLETYKVVNDPNPGGCTIL